MAILQKKFKLTAAQARKHMDMFLKDDVQIDEMIDISSHSSRRLASILNNPMHPLHSIAKAEHDRRMMTREATYSDTGWQKPEVKKDKFGNVIKDKNVAKNLAKSAMKSFKDIRKK